MDAIIEEIYNKIIEFGVKHLGELPTVLMLNHEHYYEIMAAKDCSAYVTVDLDNGEKTIMGMEYQIKDDIEEITVQ